jgi:HSP20 family protein
MRKIAEKNLDSAARTELIFCRPEVEAPGIEKTAHVSPERGLFIMAMTFDPFAELDRLAGTLLVNPQGPRFMPVDLYRDGERYVLSADMPGLDADSVDIDVDGQLLTIRARRTAEDREGVSWIARERPFGSYLRQFNLGEGVDAENIEAHYDNGVLSVLLPVSERAKPRKIEVKSGTPQQSVTAG